MTRPYSLRVWIRRAGEIRSIGSWCDLMQAEATRDGIDRALQQLQATGYDIAHAICGRCCEDCQGQGILPWMSRTGKGRYRRCARCLGGGVLSEEKLR